MTERTLPRPTDIPWRLVANGLGVAALLLFALAVIPMMLAAPGVTDAESYWMLDLDNVYGVEAGRGGAFLYSPLIAQVIYPLTLLPVTVFYSLMFAANLAALCYLVTPLGAVAVLLLTPAAAEVTQGNIHLLLAAALVAGIRHPAWWALFPLTKVTPALLIGWHRRWYVPVLVALGLSLVSAVIAPHLWVEWAARLAVSSQGSISEFVWTDWPLWLRLGISAGIVVLARWRDRRLALPFALLFSMPIPWWNSLVVLLAVPALLRREPSSR